MKALITVCGHRRAPKGLMQSARRPRVGFPAQVLFAMHGLQKDHDLVYPDLAHRVNGVWSI
jgi:hypothetical protein